MIHTDDVHDVGDVAQESEADPRAVGEIETTLIHKDDGDDDYEAGVDFLDVRQDDGDNAHQPGVDDDDDILPPEAQ